jgi:hypothetical protein
MDNRTIATPEDDKAAAPRAARPTGNPMGLQTAPIVIEGLPKGITRDIKTLVVNGINKTQKLI